MDTKMVFQRPTTDASQQGDQRSVMYTPSPFEWATFLSPWGRSSCAFDNPKSTSWCETESSFPTMGQTLLWSQDFKLLQYILILHMINIIMHARTKNQRPMPFKGQEVYFSVHEPVTTINRYPPLPTNLWKAPFQFLDSVYLSASWVCIGLLKGGVWDQSQSCQW